MMRRTLFACLVGLLTITGLSACSLPISVPTAAASSSSEPPSADPGVGGAGGGGTDPSSETPEPPTPSDQQLGPVVASRTTSGGGKTVHLDLYRIVRDGKLAHVTFAVRSSDGFQVGDMFSAGFSRFEVMLDAADGVTLTDTAHSKLYLVAGDGKHQCLCSMDLSSVTLEHDRPALISASFAVPPSDVKEMDVQIPRFGVFTRVPVV